MRVCPCCGYVDPFCWRDAYSRGMEMDYARIDDLEEAQPEIAKKLKDSLPDRRGNREFQDQYFAYKLFKSGYVRRRFIEIWKIQRWKPIPMEKHIPKDRFQTKLLEVL